MANYVNLLRMTDLSRETLRKILKVSAALKKAPENDLMKGETLALIFEKPSLRTRVSFQLAAEEMGGRALVLRPDEIKMGVREAVKDIARYLSRNVTIAAMRVFSHGTLDEFARYATIPVVNALCDEEHPCQAFADLLTIRECFGKLEGVNITYLGDGNNVCCSLMVGAAMTGANMTVGCPRATSRRRPSPRKSRRSPPKRARLSTSSTIPKRPPPARRSSTRTSGSAWARRRRRPNA